MNVRYAAKSDVGKVREGNEDSYLVSEPLFAVADGMGGHLAGDVASRIAVEVLTKDIDSARSGDRDSLVSAVKHANSAIFEKSQSDSDLSGMGTTCTLLYVVDGEARIAHVGDSRAYLLRKDNLSQLTDDHTLVNRMVKEGRLRPEDAERHPQRSIITRALGVDASVKVDYRTLGLEPGDRILICSDGLTSMLDVATIRQVLAETSDLESAADRLIELANDAGGEDNITVVLVDVTEDGSGSSTGSATAQPVVREPVRTDPRSPSSEPARATRSPRRWLRRLLVWIVALAVLVVGGYFLVDVLLDRSWFVGANDDGYVAIYQGIPEEVAGLDLKDEEAATMIPVGDLPEFLREDVEEGIKVGSQAEAKAKVADLRIRAQATRDAERARERQQRQDQEKNN